MKYIYVLALVFIISCNQKNKCYEQHKKIKSVTTVYGLDVSHHQGEINWSKVKEHGIVYVYLKATQNTHFKDPKFSKNRIEATANCVHNGAYHFYVSGENPTVQAENFITTVDSLVRGDLPPVLDLEELGIQQGVNVDTYQQNVLIWLGIVEKKWGVKPIIYTDTFFANKYLNNKEFAEYPFWIAQYTKNEKPTIPNTWSGKTWTFWQRSDRKKINGIKSKVDFDLFNGNGKEFRKLLY